MIASNSTTYDTAAIDGIAMLVKPRGAPELPIHVKWLSGRSPYGRYVYGKHRSILLWMPRHFPRVVDHGDTPGYIGDVVCQDWRQFVIYILAHEHRHAWQDQSGRWPEQFDPTIEIEALNRNPEEWEAQDAELEHDADKFALAMLARYG